MHGVATQNGQATPCACSLPVRSSGAESDPAHVLRWQGRILSAEDVRQNLNGHRTLILAPRSVVTPLAAEQLRTKGVQITRQEPETKQKSAPLRTFGFAQEWPLPLVRSAVQALERDGLVVKELPAEGEAMSGRWARSVADCVSRGDCCGGVVFCHDPSLFCCVANKVVGLRAAAVFSVAQAARATLTLGANLLAVEMPGRTFFEIRQILRTLCAPNDSACPDGIACTLQELDGHAHR